MIRSWRVGAVVVSAWLALHGCQRAADHEAGTERPLVRGEGVAVAHVNGDPISLSEVQQLCDATQLSPHKALERLVAERLLAQHAAARGYGALPEVKRAQQQASVRVLLAQELEGPGQPPQVEQRRGKLQRWLAALARQTRVTYDEATIGQAFAADPR